MPRIQQREVDILVRLYEIYDGHRDALLWFLHDFGAKNYSQYRKKYPGSSRERGYFTAICGFFELSGVLVKRGLLDEDLFFDVFNPRPYWERARATIQGMKKDRPHIYENFEFLTRRREEWSRRREGQARTRSRR